MNNTVSFNQITLITDGYSNEGISPIISAQRALEKNIIVNVIGITNGGSIAEKGVSEIENIAKAGGGLYQIVPVEKIAKTVQMVTRTAVNKTIEQAVYTQLSELIGTSQITSLPPEDRIKVASMIDNLSEHSKLNIHLLIDQSSSMLPKLTKVKEAVVDFQLSLQARAGESKISLATFPGLYNYIDIKIPWTSEIHNIDSLLYNLRPKGSTPTGPALMESINYFSILNHQKGKNGVLDEYII